MSQQSLDLTGLARQAMLNHGFQLDMTPPVEDEIARLAPIPASTNGIRDLRQLLLRIDFSQLKICGLL